MTKKRIAFVTDSTAYLPEKLQNHPDVYVVPIVIISDNRELEDGVDLSSDQLYNMIRTHKEVPKTSQPNVGKFIDLYERLKEEYDAAIAIHVSSKLSGTISSSTTAKDQVGFPVEVIDSLSLSFAITDLLDLGLTLTEQEKDLKEIANKLREKATSSQNLILLGSLEQLYKGGRMSGAQFLVGNLLKIKPILTIKSNGELDVFEKVRSEKKATNRIISLLKQSYDKHNVRLVAIMHGNVFEKAQQLKQKIENEIPQLQVLIGGISSSLAVHGGEGTLALFWNED